MEKSQGINFIITEDQARIIADANGLDYDELDSDILETSICEALDSIIEEL